MPRQLWLADAARKAGLTVVEVDGWEERGSEAFYPRGVVCHHTAGPAGGGDMPSLGVLINGRSDLPSPLAHYGLGRSGTVYVVAAGRANHAGTGGWRGLSGNSSVVGIEAENNGRQPWPEVQINAYHRLCAALARRLWGVAYVCGHKEWTTRKPDPHSLDMFAFRAVVERYVREQEGMSQLDTIQAEATAAKNYAIENNGFLIASVPRIERIESVVNGIAAVCRALADENAELNRKVDELLARPSGGTGVGSCWIKERI